MTSAYIHADPRVRIPNKYAGAQYWKAYTPEDHAVWYDLITAQTENVRSRVCTEWQDGLKTLGLIPDRIPDYRRLDKRLHRATDWHLAVVNCFIPADVFFHLLSKRHFPVTPWLRARENMDYIPEPDMVHDVWAHTPVLTMWPFADYLHAFGKAGVKSAKMGLLDQVQRLYWYTVEFALTENEGRPKISGAGIISSKGETLYVLDSPKSHHVAFDPVRVMRTHYRIDEFQLTYPVLKNFKALLDLKPETILELAREAKESPQISWSQVKRSDKVIRYGTVTKADDHGMIQAARNHRRRWLIENARNPR